MQTAILTTSTPSPKSSSSAISAVQLSALSHQMSDLEGRLKIKLLNRTTRAVSTTEAGQQLRERIAPLFSGIQQELGALVDFTHEMRGKIRINCPERHAYELIYPRLSVFLRTIPMWSWRFLSTTTIATSWRSGLISACARVKTWRAIWWRCRFPRLTK